MFSEDITGFDYLPAVALRLESVGLCVEFYAREPGGRRMLRHRVKLNRVAKRLRTERERMAFAQSVAADINGRLDAGWRPSGMMMEEDGLRGGGVRGGSGRADKADAGRGGRERTGAEREGVTARLLADEFLSAKRLEGLRKRTLDSYRSFAKKFTGWMAKERLHRLQVGNMERGVAVRFMDYVLRSGVSNRAYNNTLKFMRCFFHWAVEHGYCEENFFSAMRLLRKEPKRRILVDAESRGRIAEYYDRERPQMGIVCRLVYSSAVRPKEVANLRVGDVNLAERYVRITADNAKNGKERFATLSAELVERLRPVVEGVDGGWFLFGSGKAMLPGAKGVSHSYFGKVWSAMREELGLPAEMQLYSLRDTGLVDLLHAGVDPLTVRQHADHSSLAMQDIYTSHYDPELNRKIFESGVEF